MNLEGPTSLVAAEIDRFPKAATVIINTTVIKKDGVVAGSPYKYYSVSATFDQGTNAIFNLSSAAIRVQDI